MASLTTDMSLSKLQEMVNGWKPGVLQFTRLQGVGHDSATEQQQQQFIFIKGLPWWLSGKELTCNAGDAGSIPVRSLSRKIPWRRKWQPTPVFLLGKCHRRRSLVGYSPRSCKELDTTERLHFHFPFLYLPFLSLGLQGDPTRPF